MLSTGSGGTTGDLPKAAQSERRMTFGWEWVRVGELRFMPLATPHHPQGAVTSSGDERWGETGVSGVSGWGLKPPASTLRGEKKVTSSQSASSEGTHRAGNGLKCCWCVSVQVRVHEGQWLTHFLPRLNHLLRPHLFFTDQQYAHLCGTSWQKISLNLFPSSSVSLELRPASVYKWHDYSEYLPQQLLSLLHLWGSYRLRQRQ